MCCTQVEGMCKEGEEGGTAHQPPFLAANRCFTAPQCCAGLPVSLPVAVAAGRVVAPNLAVWCARSPRRGDGTFFLLVAVGVRATRLWRGGSAPTVR